MNFCKPEKTCGACKGTGFVDCYWEDGGGDGTSACYCTDPALVYTSAAAVAVVAGMTPDAIQARWPGAVLPK